MKIIKSISATLTICFFLLLMGIAAGYDPDLVSVGETVARAAGAMLGMLLFGALTGLLEEYDSTVR